MPPVSSPFVMLFFAGIGLGAYLALSSYLAAMWTGRRLLPRFWSSDENPERRRIWSVIETVIAVFAVAVLQLAMLGVAINPGEQPASRIVAAAELLLALVWTGYAAGVYSGRFRGSMYLEVDPSLDARVRDLEGLARELTEDHLRDLAVVMKQENIASNAWSAGERYWFSGSGGATLSRYENRAVRKLWTRFQVGLTFAVTGIDINPPADTGRRGLGTRLARLLQPEYIALQGQAATLLERHGGGDIWLPVTGVWNAFCAALLDERLDPELRAALETPWRLAIGATPRERLARALYASGGK